MSSLLVSVDDRLANAGDTISVVRHVDVPMFRLGEREFALPSGIDVDIMLTNAGEGILATGIARAQAVSACDRCLDPATLEVAGEVDEYYLFCEPEPGVAGDGEQEGADYLLVSPDSTIDLKDAVSAAIAMDIPYVVLCKPDCAGLCPVCGENLNHVDCGHAAQLEAEAEEQRISQSPFSALKDMRFDE